MTMRRRAALQAVVWSGYAIVSLGMIANFQALTGSLIFVMLALAVLLWVASEGLRALALRQAWLEGSSSALALRLALLPPLAAVAVQVALHGINTLGLLLGLLVFPAGTPQGLGVLLAYALNTAILLWLWMAVWLGVKALQRWRQGEIAKWQAEAAARAREMLSRLSNTLRHTLQHSAKERVPLADELAVVRDYIALEQLHHEERLRVAWQVDPSTAGASVPPMLLQLLVENAIKHGIARTAGGGEVGITLRRDGAQLTLTVSNPGQWQPGSSDSTGLGLAHLRERLQRAGGPGADCRIEAADGRVNVTVTLTP